MSVTELKRCFQFGSIELPDVPGIEAPQDVIKLYESNYPELAFATLDQPRREGDRLIYEIIPPVAKTKG